MEGGSGKGRVAAAKRLSAPRSLKATNVAWGGVTLKWAAPKGAKPKHYLILRDGKSLGKTTRNTFTDTKVKPGTAYRYTVRALDERNRAGALSSSVRVKVPAQGGARAAGTDADDERVAADRDRHADRAARPDVDPESDAHGAADPDPDADGDRDAHRDRHADRDPDRDGHRHPDRDGDRHPDGDRHRHPDRDGDRHPDGDGDRHDRPRPPPPPRPRPPRPLRPPRRPRRRRRPPPRPRRRPPPRRPPRPRPRRPPRPPRRRRTS